MPEIILASNSPRRRQLLAWTGWSFEVAPVEIDETPQPGETPEVYVTRLAASKAEVRARKSPVENLILAADTVVADRDNLLGKPSDHDDAARMLRDLRGHAHQVCTAITLISPGGAGKSTDLCCSQVPMRSYSDAEIKAYVATGDPMDKAGAYAIQDAMFHPVENFHGCFASVMGLPLCHLVRSMARLGISAPRDVPAVCQSQLQYACPVSSAILRGENAG